MEHIISDTLQGIAIGDAFGVGVEFVDREVIRQQVQFDVFVNLRQGKYGENYIPGDYSDDTEHSIGVVKALLSDAPMSEQLLLHYWKTTYECDLLRKGYPRQGHGSIEHRYTGEQSIEQVRASQAAREDPGNAPVMRAVPFGFVDESLHQTYAIINADSTHPHPLAREASLMIIKATHHLLVQQRSKETLIPALKPYLQTCTYEKLLQISQLPTPNGLQTQDYVLLCGQQPIPYMQQKGVIVHGLPCESLTTACCVIYILLHSETAFEALQQSIRMGGDVDSLAAVTTGILAGKDGLGSLPSFLLQQTEGLAELAKLGRQLGHKLATE